MFRSLASKAFHLRPTFSQPPQVTRFGGITRMLSDVSGVGGGGGGDGKVDEVKSTEESGRKQTGSVKWFDSRRGFGFIVPSDGSRDVFVHHSNIHSRGFRNLDDGEEVEFDIIVDESGRRFAADVTGPYGSFVRGKRYQRVENSSYGDYDRRGRGGYGGEEHL